MFFDPESLLLGPRGRRLCLELATAGPHAPELHSAVFYAGHELDPGRGRSRVLFGPGSDEPPPPHAPADVAAALDSMPLPEPDGRSLLQVLDRVLSAARYWQEPDGEDVLCAAPEMRDALAGVARRVAAAPAAAWWTTALDRDAQATVRFTDGPQVERTADPAAGLSRWRSGTIEDEHRAQRERPRDPRAAFSGYWWSAPPFDMPSSTRFLDGLGPVGLWLVEDSMGWERAVTHRAAVPEDAAVFEIDGPEAWAALCRRYPLEVTAARRHDWFRTTGRDGRWVLPDWSRVAADVDAVHLTAHGYLTTAGRAITVDEDAAAVLAGWDPDSTCWFTGIGERGIGQHWRNDDAAGWKQLP
ncbi:hypothetical protein IQ251_13040 [Saccharopolyspora sp. HNM0983]|uniref:Uncharacterized protein n=1 Tax=Saccharopolyspora montiporae TaxID=2781240 RepID=A0A929BD85_9PSEU|nr:hypothetical protein [Saccharopolyspora sp. HNM0983]MBE9375372.1 hypothetical protein [Saccharopolyspora sp. HNM0983]